MAAFSLNLQVYFVLVDVGAVALPRVLALVWCRALRVLGVPLVRLLQEVVRGSQLQTLEFQVFLLPQLLGIAFGKLLQLLLALQSKEFEVLVLNMVIDLFLDLPQPKEFNRYVPQLQL